MPITVRVAEHDAEAWPRSPWNENQRAEKLTPKTSEAVLRSLNHKKISEVGSILETSIGHQTSLTDARLKEMNLDVQDHGLVRGALEAYSHHHHLVLRPEDIWFAVLTQFSFYVNAHSEELRSSFVAHEGKKGLIVEDPDQDDMSVMCRNMTKLIDKNIVDPKLREWILPVFTTTTMHDEVVASVIMMGTLQKYFEYVFDCACCGIPTITLLGELSDWEEIQRRIEKLAEYGKEPTLFCEVLRPIIRNFIATFTSPPGDESVKRFWSKIISHTRGSGMNYLSGWIVAFCFWDEDGKCLGRGGDGTIQSVVRRTVNFDEVPAGFVSVPVTYIDPMGVVIEAKLLAGFVGYEATTAVSHQGNKNLQNVDARRPEDKLDEDDELYGYVANRRKVKTPTKISLGPDASPLNSLQPVTGWWMYTINGAKNDESRIKFYENKISREWKGQASTGTVSPDGEMRVRDGLPRNVEDVLFEGFESR